MSSNWAEITARNWGATNPKLSDSSYAMIAKKNWGAPDGSGGGKGGITTGEAFGRLVAARLLTAEPEIKIPIVNKTIVKLPSAADLAEGVMISGVNKLNRRLGIDTPLTRPTPEKLTDVANDIIRKFTSILGGSHGIPGPGKIKSEVVREARMQTDMLYRGNADNTGKPTEEEERVAQQLSLLVGHVPASEIRRMLYQSVLQRAGDTVLTQKQAYLNSVGPRFQDGLRRLEAELPRESYIAPWVTTEVMFPPEDQPLVENTTWSLTPTSLIVRRVLEKSQKEDTRYFPLQSIITGMNPNGGVLVSDGTPPYADYLIKWGTRLFQPIFKRLIGTETGGIVVLRQTQAMQDPVTIAVPDAKYLRGVLQKLAAVNQEAYAADDMIERALLEHDKPLLPPIRPNVVKKLMPPLATEVNLPRFDDGTIDMTSVRKIIKVNEGDVVAALQGVGRKIDENKQLIVETGGADQLKKRLQEIEEQKSREIAMLRNPALESEGKLGRAKKSFLKENDPDYGRKVDNDKVVRYVNSKWRREELVLREKLRRLAGANTSDEAEVQYASQERALKRSLKENRRKIEEIDSQMTRADEGTSKLLGAIVCPKCGGPNLDGGRCEYCGGV